MSLVRVQNATVAYDGRIILRQVSFRLAALDRVGLIGKNGSGKTSLLNLLRGQLVPIDGRVDRTPGVSLAYFSQFSELDDQRAIQDMLADLFADVRALDAELAAISTQLAVAGVPEQQALLERQADLLEQITQRDGWDYQRHIDTALTMLGFNQTRRAQPVSELSGGWRNRAALAVCLLSNPDILLLDEPTNYLDVDGVTWLERWLTTFGGGILVVSHDRRFLDRVVTRIVEVEHARLWEYSGNYTAYVRQKPFRLKALERQFVHEEELLLMEAEALRDREELRRTPDVRLLRKLADIRKRQPPRPVDTIVTSLYSSLHVPARLGQVERLHKAFGPQVLFRDLSFELQRGDRLAIVGPNGSGKSTLLRMLTGDEAADGGRIAWQGGAAVADYTQAARNLDLDDTVTHAVNVMPLAFTAPRKLVHRFLAMLQFTEHDLQQPIRALSGGQRARLVLAQCLLSGAATLLLDEPTNHLDVTSIQVMERALSAFPGAVVVVSHDRFFIDKVATQLLVLDGQGTTTAFTGTWTMWEARATERWTEPDGPHLA